MTKLLLTQVCLLIYNNINTVDKINFKTLNILISSIMKNYKEISGKIKNNTTLWFKFCKILCRVDV